MDFSSTSPPSFHSLIQLAPSPCRSSRTSGPSAPLTSMLVGGVQQGATKALKSARNGTVACAGSYLTMTFGLLGCVCALNSADRRELNVSLGVQASIARPPARSSLPPFSPEGRSCQPSDLRPMSEMPSAKLSASLRSV